ncbi:serpin B6-like [Centruroides sculpturatus]|uniref:serpin B6-like n=1 Tax=Centruroides sculpturatus TaxID=218467 RepID=UPI000C6DF303|nr:serpin B6-like [Centruroides sculpturatus]
MQLLLILFAISLILPFIEGYGRGVSSGISAFIESNNNFAFALYKDLLKEKNLVISPWSISRGLASIYLGAQNYTKREMEEVLFKNEAGVTGKEMIVSYGHLERLLKRKAQVDLTTFNAAMIQQESPVSETYKHRLFHYFNSILYDLDMANHGKLVRDWINILVEIKTNGLIKDILTKVPTSDTILLLLNGIHYKGEWVQKFDPELTTVSTFYNIDKVPVQAAMMLSTSNFTYRYSHLDDVHVLRLPLQGKFAMTFVMPGENGSLEEVGKTLNYKTLQRIISEEATPKMIKLSLPKFKLESKEDLAEALIDLGMHTLFSPVNADLGGIDQNKGLFLKDVIHQATVEVSEEGVEAAATTLLGVESRLGAIYIPFNRPFMFLIEDLDTGLIIFMGHLSDCTNVCAVPASDDQQKLNSDSF